MGPIFYLNDIFDVQQRYAPETKFKMVITEFISTSGSGFDQEIAST